MQVQAIAIPTHTKRVSFQVHMMPVHKKASVYSSDLSLFLQGRTNLEMLFRTEPYVAELCVRVSPVGRKSNLLVTSAQPVEQNGTEDIQNIQCRYLFPLVPSVRL